MSNRLAVIIPVHNGTAVLPACLEALRTTTGCELSILCVENGSSDGSAELIASHFPEVRLLRYASPLGFAGAANAGLRAAQQLPVPASAYALLNQDTIVDPGWAAALLAALASDNQLGIVGSLARFPDGRIQHAGAELLEPRWYGRNRTNLAECDQGTGFQSFLAVCLHPTMLQQLGLLDEGFGAGYFEDADYCLRAVAAGWKHTLAPEATLVHHEGAITRTSYRHAALIERNRLRLLLKHRSLPELHDHVLPAEQAALRARASTGESQVLRQAYLQALIQLPAIAQARALTASELATLAAQLAALRQPAPALAAAPGNASNEQRIAAPAPAPAAALRQPVPYGHGIVESTHGLDNAVPVQPHATIIILTWNGLEYTRACLESIRAHDAGMPYQIIVVDNGSTDGTLEWLHDQPDVQLIANDTNLGYTRGNNQGMQAAAPESDLLLLNNDTVITQAGWLARLHAVAHADPRHGIVGCLLLHSNGLLQHAGTYMPTSTFWGYQVGGGEVFVGQYPGVREVEGITGACMYIRHDVYDTIGGLDPAYVSYYEDSDYCLRARAAGYAVVVTGDVQLTHHENVSSRVNRADWRALFSTGRQTFQQRWQHTLTQRYTRAIFWHSLFALPTGYSTSSRELVRQLDAQAVDVRVACVFGTDYTEPPTGDPRIDQLRSRPKDLSLPQVVYSQADAFLKNSGRYKIGFSMHEADRLPEDWVYQANQMDEIWTPTHWGKQVFADSGITRPIHVIPLGFNPDYFHPGIDTRRASRHYTFLAVFDWIERKGPEILLHAYLNSFKPTDEVLLLLKVTNTDPNFNLQQQVHQLVGNRPTPAIALLVNHKIPDAQLGGLYRSADCFVLPTRGEGWGMPALEAMACGLPVISTDWGAQQEFLHPGTGYPLRIRGLTPAIARSPYYGGARWADPDREHLGALMRYVYEHQDEARLRGEQAAREVHARWTWRHAAERIIARLDAITQ